MEPTTNNAKKTTAPIDALMDTVRTQGQLWARYGLTLGRLALETNARALGQLASSLGQLAEALDVKEPSSSSPEATTPAKGDDAKS
jgi:hypothetical protein